MENRLRIEFFIIRYVPDVVRGEFINIGIILREFPSLQDLTSHGQVHVRVTRDWRRLRAFGPRVDLQLLGRLESEITLLCRADNSYVDSPSDRGADFIATMLNTFSNSIQISDAKVSLATGIDSELERLMRMYVAPLVPIYLPPDVGHPFLLSSIRRSFQQVDLWRRMNRNFSAQPFTARGDSLVLNCGYIAHARDVASSKANVFRVYQAISLVKGANRAKALAYSAPSLKSGVSDLLGAELCLTAVIEDLEPLLRSIEPRSDVETYHRFAVETLQAAEIRVIGVAELQEAQELASQELLSQ